MQTVIWWIIAGIAVAFTTLFALTVRFWRSSKKSPYYYLRRQAEQRMQTSSLATIVCAVLLVFLISYSLQPKQDTTLRVTFLANAKPLESVEAAEIDSESELAANLEESPEVIDIDGATPTQLTSDLISQQSTFAGSAFADEFETATVEEAEQILELPAEYARVTPLVQTNENTRIADMSFTTQIDSVTLVALDPDRVFSPGSFTMYATFDYEGMEDGMAWSWVWYRDGQIVSGGNELWAYGQDGPGYVFFNPREGFATGEYVLQVWVNNNLMQEANLFITDDIAATR